MDDISMMHITSSGPAQIAEKMADAGYIHKIASMMGIDPSILTPELVQKAKEMMGAPGVIMGAAVYHAAATTAVEMSERKEELDKDS